MPYRTTKKHWSFLVDDGLLASICDSIISFCTLWLIAIDAKVAYCPFLTILSYSKFSPQECSIIEHNTGHVIPIQSPWHPQTATQTHIVMNNLHSSDRYKTRWTPISPASRKTPCKQFAGTWPTHFTMGKLRGIWIWVYFPIFEVLVCMAYITQEWPPPGWPI